MKIISRVHSRAARLVMAGLRGPACSGSSWAEPLYTVSPLQGLENRLGANRVSFAQVCAIDSPRNDTSGLAEAKALAAAADVVVLVGGLDETMEGEGWSIGGGQWTATKGVSQFAITVNENGAIPEATLANNGYNLTKEFGQPVAVPEHWLPGRVEAEHFADFHGFESEPAEDSGGGINLSYIDPGDYLEYAIKVPEAANYTFTFRVASSGGGRFRVDTMAGTGPEVEVPDTGGWQNWINRKAEIALSAGPQRLRLSVLAGGFNLNWIDAGDTHDDELHVVQAGEYTVRYRMAAPSGGGRLELLVDGTVLDTVTAPTTGDYQNWSTVNRSINLPGGSHTFRLRALDAGYNLNWMAFDREVVPDRLETWRFVQFGSIDALDRRRSGDLADPDADQLDNLLEYKLGLDPLMPDPEPFVRTFARSGSAAQWRFAAAVRRDRDDVELVPEASGNLADWTPVPTDEFEIESNDLDTSWTDRTWRLFLDPADETAPRFFRLRARASEE